MNIGRDWKDGRKRRRIRRRRDEIEEKMEWKIKERRMRGRRTEEKRMNEKKMNILIEYK